MNETRYVTRFAPSPTGLLHLGNARTALLSLLAAKQSGGRFILRIEDTDQARGDAALERRLLEDLAWLSIAWDEGPDVGGPSAPYRQSERGELHRGALNRLTQSGRTYACFCTQTELALARRAQLAAGQAPRYAGTCRKLTPAEQAERRGRGLPAALRFEVPAGKIVTFTDVVHGAQRFATDDIGDFVIQRADGSMSFFFANALDDAAMGVNLVLRGADHLANTPRQLLILEALELPAPTYGHVSLLHGEDGVPLSKRHGAASLHDFRERGYLPEALRNHLVRLGHTCERDGWLSDRELVEQFSLSRLGRAPARFEVSQLQHWQKLAVAHASPARLREWLGPAVQSQVGSERCAAFVDLIRGNVVLPEGAVQWAARLAAKGPSFDADARQVIEAAGADFYTTARDAVASAGCDLKTLAQAISNATGKRGPDLYKPLRAALTGALSGPELAPTIGYLGADEVARRFEAARTLAS